MSILQRILNRFCVLRCWTFCAKADFSSKVFQKMMWKIQSLYHILYNILVFTRSTYSVHCYNNNYTHNTYIFYTHCMYVFAKLDVPHVENKAFFTIE